MTNKQLFKSAKRFIPGGVNSPVRSFKSIGGTPVFIQRAKGATLWDEEGKAYLDYCASWGPMILGHAHQEITRAITHAAARGTSYGTATKAEIQLAQLITELVPSIENVRLTCSGTEAVMSAVRLARAYTGKVKIIKFDGAYHGHADYLLVKGGSGLATLGTPDSLGVPKDFAKHTLVAPFNNLAELEALIKKHQGELAALLVEPVLGNCGVILPEKNYLKALRALATRYGFLLIFDEVITGFRLSLGGAQKHFGIKPDLTCLGKIIGGGLPIGAFGGPSQMMKMLAPLGNVYQAGTLAGNPVAVAAGLAMLKTLKKMNPYRTLEKKAKFLTSGIDSLAKKHGIPVTINTIGSLFTIFFTEGPVRDYASAKTQSSEMFSRFYHALLEEGIYLSPSGFEANFISTAHTDRDLKMTLGAVDRVFAKIRKDTNHG